MSDVNLGLPLRASRHKELGETVANPALSQQSQRRLFHHSQQVSLRENKKKERKRLR